MDLEQRYKEESGFSIGKIHDIGTVYYSNDYVEWLEKQLTIPVVSGRSELLNTLIDGINEEFETYAYLPELNEYIKAFNCH